MVLARVYRPKTFAQLIGQDLLVKTLQSAIAANNLPHAFLFHGIRGTGKTTIARILARCLNCENDHKPFPAMTPCLKCQSCINIDLDRHMDVVEIDAASNTSVDNVRELIESARYKPVQGRYKVFIIDEVHMLSKSAFNALLKTLEEPPGHVKFILATTELRKIPETVLSRCMRFDLKRIEPPQLMQHLKKILEQEGIESEDDALALIIRASEGSVRDALSLLDQGISLSRSFEGSIDLCSDSNACTIHLKVDIINSMLGSTSREFIFDLLQMILKSDYEGIWQLTKSLYGKGANPVFILKDLLDVIYWCTALKKMPKITDDVLWSKGDRERGWTIVQPLSLSILLRLWQILLKSYEEISRSPNPSQALDMTFLRLCFAKELPPIEEVLKAFSNPSQNSSSQEPQETSGIKHHNQLNFIKNDLLTNKTIESNLHRPETFEDFLKLLESERELLLIDCLKRHVYIDEYKLCSLKLTILDGAPALLKNKLKEISAKLEKITGLKWSVVVSFSEKDSEFAQKTQATERTEKDETRKTFFENQEEQDNIQKNDISSFSLIQRIQEEFKNIKIDFMKNP
jgi:DNA polymerase-3 subunit gamma/tau